MTWDDQNQTEPSPPQSSFAGLTRQQLVFRCTAFQKRQDNLVKKLADANSRNTAYQKEILRLKQQLAKGGEDIPRKVFGELLEKIGKEFSK